MTVPLTLLSLLTFLFLAVVPSHAIEFTGRVVSVKDGDTIEVLHNRTAERIRFAGIDCAEKKQAFGTRAKQAASALSFGQDVRVHSTGKDRSGRSLGIVVLPNESSYICRNGESKNVGFLAPHEIEWSVRLTCCLLVCCD